MKRVIISASQSPNTYVISVFKSNNLLKQGVDPSSFNTSECTYYSIQGCYLKVTKL